MKAFHQKVGFYGLFCLEEKIEMEVYARAATVSYWDGNAQWYKLWVEHNRYHNSIIQVLTSYVKPGWRVLDIGAGNGILSLPLCAMGCDVTAVEPSSGMQRLLQNEVIKWGIHILSIDKRRLKPAATKDSKKNRLI